MKVKDFIAKLSTMPLEAEVVTTGNGHNYNVLHCIRYEVAEKDGRLLLEYYGEANMTNIQNEKVDVVVIER